MNLHALITRGEDGVTLLEFRYGGMMQVWVDGPVQVLTPGWTVEGDRITGYGPAGTLELIY